MEKVMKKSIYSYQSFNIYNMIKKTYLRRSYSQLKYKNIKNRIILVSSSE